MASVEDPTPLSIPLCPSFTVHGNQSSGQHLAQKSDHVPVPEAPQIRPGKRPIASAIDAVLDRRAQAGRLIAGVAAASDSDMFKGPQLNKPKARRWDGHLTEESLRRKPCILKQAAKYLKNPGLISLGGGLPSSQLFPFAELGIKVPSVPHFDEKDMLDHGKLATIGKYDARDNNGTYDLSIALNYGQATGSPQMLRFVTEHMEIVFNPPYADWRVCQSIGNTGALEEALRMFCDRERGDSILTEMFSFSTALETMAPLGIKVYGSPLDDQGLIPEAMDEILTNWDVEARGSKKPHVLYTVPSGQNPTGATQSAKRRRDLYLVARKHDIFIIEDEPYYFLQMQPYTGRNQADVSAPADVDEFVAALVPSLLSFDVDGRVMRLDSFSKVIVPGSRLGWVTASEQIIERYQRHAEASSQGPNGFSQVIMHKLLDETWGHEGYLKWLMNLRMEYTKKRDVLLAACEDHLPREVISWTAPAAGMFLWLKVDHSQHPQAETRSLNEVEDEIFESCVDSGVLVAKGSWFLAEKDGLLPGLFFRATFATASAEAMTEAIRRFGRAVRDSFGLDLE